jgi:hypothetical protein
MAGEFYPAALQVQQPDILKSYIQGQMAPLQVAQAQQGLQAGALDIDKLRLALKQQGMTMDLAQQLAGQTLGAQNAGGPSGGLQNGPQAAVSAPKQESGSYNGSFGSNPRVNTMMALDVLQGRDPLKTAQGAQEYEQKQRQLQAQGPMSLAESVISSQAPERLILNNPSLMQGWRSYAPKLGLDPSDPRAMTPHNVRSAATLFYNDLAGSAGLPPKAMPTQLQNVNLGNGEIGQINPLTGKKEGDLVERQNPSFSLVDKFDPATNTTVKVPVQTGGYGMSGVNPATGAGTPSGFNAGMKAPTDPEFKAAMFASEMRSGMNTMQRMETQGFNLSPSTRAMVINAATSEDSGVLKQLLSQEALVHGMSKSEQTYVAALMPMLQAAGHDQSGARLTTAQVRQNVESLLPVDVRNKDALKQVQDNRQGFYTGLLTQAGAAAQLPQYKSSLGADLQSAQDSARFPTKMVGGKTYEQFAPGRWRER